jgi:hypothetical protein
VKGHGIHDGGSGHIIGGRNQQMQHTYKHETEKEPHKVEVNMEFPCVSATQHGRYTVNSENSMRPFDRVQMAEHGILDE